MRKPAFCICENKDADQLRGNREADQRLCFPYADSTMPLLPTSEISSLQPSSIGIQPGLCGTLPENPEDRFSHNEARYTFIISDQTVDVQADLPLSVNIIGLSGLAFMCFFSLMLLCVTQCMVWRLYNNI